jgi:hypothetical protein
LSDGREFRFENSGNIQRIYDRNGRLISASVWTKDGPQPLSNQSAFLGAGAAAGGAAEAIGIDFAAVLAAGAALYAWLSSRNDRNRAAVIAFSPTEFEPGTKQPKALFVGRLTEQELNDACPKHPKVQEFTDKAAAKARHDRSDWGPAGFGTEVRKLVARDVTGIDPNTGKPGKLSEPQDPNFLAEVSALKTLAADADAPPLPRYGEKGTVRVDVLENRPKIATVCIYDIKTGERALYIPRMLEIARSVYKYYPNTERMIITEIRPHR